MEYMEISILEAEKRANPVLNIRDFFTAYLIETKYTIFFSHFKIFRMIIILKNNFNVWP